MAQVVNPEFKSHYLQKNKKREEGRVEGKEGRKGGRK
jgi:hypothetical protein